MDALDTYTDQNFRDTIFRALRLLCGLTVLSVPLLWWRAGWGSAVLLVVGAAISGSGLWEWLRVMTAIMASMDSGGNPQAIAKVLTGFFVRLFLIVGVLYVSLRFLEGSVMALVAGLGSGIFCLMFESLRLAKSWTV